MINGGKNLRKLLCMGLAVLISINLVACSNKTIAKVNDVKISIDEYKKVENLLYTINYIEEKSDESNVINEDVLSFIIDNEVIYQEALKSGIQVSDKEVDEKYEQLKSSLNKNLSYRQKIEGSGLDEEFLKKQVKKDIVVNNYKDDFIKNIKISDEEIEDYYNQNIDKFSVKEVRASQILISILDKDNNIVSNDQKEKLKKRAEEILNKLKNGESFETLAKVYSDDKSSGIKGGDLGYFSKDDKNIEFTNKVFLLNNNEISDVFETSYGYHIVKVTDKMNTQKTLDESKGKIKNKILNEKFSKHIDSLYKKWKIVIA